MLTDALACVIDLVGEEAPDLPQFKWTLAKVRIKQGQYKEAETLLQSAIEQKVRNSSDMHPDLIEYLEAMAELKEATGLIDEASVAHRRAEAIQATLV
jgi:thioredoxin-like negative regulator of GroEL